MTKKINIAEMGMETEVKATGTKEVEELEAPQKKVIKKSKKTKSILEEQGSSNELEEAEEIIRVLMAEKEKNKKENEQKIKIVLDKMALLELENTQLKTDLNKKKEIKEIFIEDPKLKEKNILLSEAVTSYRKKYHTEKLKIQFCINILISAICNHCEGGTVGKILKQYNSVINSDETKNTLDI